MKIRRVRIRIIVHENEDKEFLKNKFNEILLNNIDLKKIKINEDVGEGLYSYKLYVITYILDKKKYIDKFFENLFNYIDINYFIDNLNFDENYNFYFRIDKEDLSLKNKINLKYKSDAIQVKVSLDGYKKDKQKVIEFLNEYYKQIKG